MKLNYKIHVDTLMCAHHAGNVNYPVLTDTHGIPICMFVAFTNTSHVIGKIFNHIPRLLPCNISPGCDCYDVLSVGCTFVRQPSYYNVILVYIGHINPCKHSLTYVVIPRFTVTQCTKLLAYVITHLWECLCCL